MGGGGGGAKTTQTGIDPEFKPQLKRGLDISQARLEDQYKDPSKIVEKLKPEQTESLGYKTALARDAIHGRGIYDDRRLKEKALQNVYGSAAGQASSGKSYGSARSMGAMNKAVADAGDKWDINRRQVATQGIKDIGDVGSTYQQQGQKERDAMGLALNQFFGRLQQAPQQTKTTGGGKG
jgi:hypothetical protein